MGITTAQNAIHAWEGWEQNLSSSQGRASPRCLGVARGAVSGGCVGGGPVAGGAVQRQAPEASSQPIGFIKGQLNGGMIEPISVDARMANAYYFFCYNWYPVLGNCWKKRGLKIRTGYNEAFVIHWVAEVVSLYGYYLRLTPYFISCTVPPHTG